MARSFNYFVKNNDLQKTRKIYIEAVYNQDTQRLLRQWALDNSFDLTINFKQEKQSIDDFDFHTTIVFSESEHSYALIPNNSIKLPIMFRVEPIGFEMLGPNQDIPTIKLRSDHLQYWHDYYVKTYEMQQRYEQYKPHITVSYNRNQQFASNVKLPTFALMVDTINIKDQDPNV